MLNTTWVLACLPGIKKKHPSFYFSTSRVPLTLAECRQKITEEVKESTSQSQTSMKSSLVATSTEPRFRIAKILLSRVAAKLGNLRRYFGARSSFSGLEMVLLPPYWGTESYFLEWTEKRRIGYCRLAKLIIVESCASSCAVVICRK